MIIFLSLQQIMHFLQMFIIYVGVDLCCWYWSMTKKRLYGSDVGSFLDQRGGETMAQGMWRHFLADAG